MAQGDPLGKPCIFTSLEAVGNVTFLPTGVRGDLRLLLVLALDLLLGRALPDLTAMMPCYDLT